MQHPTDVMATCEEGVALPKIPSDRGERSATTSSSPTPRRWQAVPAHRDDSDPLAVLSHATTGSDAAVTPPHRTVTSGMLLDHGTVWLA